MEYQRVGDYKIKIIPERDILDILLTIARVSYETAVPSQGRQLLLPMFAAGSNEYFDGYIERDRITKTPIRLSMGVVDGRDCRTKVWQGHDDE